MMPTIEVLDMELSTYWLMCILGILFIFLLSIFRKDKYEYSLLQSIFMAAAISFFGILGVCVLGYIQSGFKTINTSFMGALIFTPICVGFFSIIIGKKFLSGMLFSVPGICLMGCLMKFGCYFTGCCGGKIIDGIQIPIQLIEALISLVIFIVILLVEMKKKKYILALYLLLYSVTRFIIEYFRDVRYDFIGMSMGQVTSLVVFGLSLLYFCIINKYHVEM